MSTLPPVTESLSTVSSDSGDAIREAVRDRYAAAARTVLEGRKSACGCSCGGSAEPRDPVTADLYTAEEVENLPPEAFLASLGCGNPTMLADLHPGETVLDLGSGGGIDVLLSARRVGPTGRAYGLDMTDEMLALARDNARRAGAENVEFLRGELEAIPLPEGAVDVVISNCVINLSADKRRALGEAFRVLKPGGRFAVSDIVLREALPEAARASLALWTGCIAGALEESEYRRLLAEVGFTAVEVEPTRVYRAEDARDFLEAAGLGADAAAALDGKVMSAFVRATRPAV